MNFLVPGLALICTILPLNEAAAWGDRGHSVVAEIAQRRLTPAAMRELHELLGAQVSMASIAAWADTVQMTRPQTINWHFVNVPFAADAYDAKRDCAESGRGDCVVGAIMRFEATLADHSAPAASRAEALKFLVHLVADIHQPMHCVDRDDAGGSRRMVSLFGAPMSLHAVWDYGLIEHHGFDWGELVRQIEDDDIPMLNTAVIGGSPVDWANESHRIAVHSAYVTPTGTELAEAYDSANYPVLKRRLALAAVRLSHLLNRALSPAPGETGAQAP